MKAPHSTFALLTFWLSASLPNAQAGVCEDWHNGKTGDDRVSVETQGAMVLCRDLLRSEPDQVSACLHSGVFALGSSVEACLMAVQYAHSHHHFDIPPRSIGVCALDTSSETFGQCLYTIAHPRVDYTQIDACDRVSGAMGGFTFRSCLRKLRDSNGALSVRLIDHCGQRAKSDEQTADWTFDFVTDFSQCIDEPNSGADVVDSDYDSWHSRNLPVFHPGQGDGPSHTRHTGNGDTR